MVTNFFEVAFELPRLQVNGGVQCLSDYHCFGNGRCTSQFSGFFECVCDSPYVGDFCQHTVNEYVAAFELTSVTMDQLDWYFQNHSASDNYLNTDLEFTVMIMRGLSKNYETINQA